MMTAFAFVGQAAVSSIVPTQINPAGAPGRPGSDGQPGAQGQPGVPGKDGVTPDVSGKLDKTGDASGAKTTATGGSYARTQADMAADVPSLLSFIPAGTTFAQFLLDATSTFQAAANAMAARSPAGGVVRLPALTMRLSGATSITQTCPIQWEGARWNELATGGGTWLHIVGTGASPFMLSGAAVRGTSFRNLGVYQDHPAPSAGWAPTVYPPVFNLSNTNGTVTFDNIFASPVYDLIRATGSGRLEVKDIRGQVFHQAYWLDMSLDTSHFTGQHHFWPFWSADTNVLNWQVANMDAFTLARVDGFEGTDAFVFAARSAVRLIQSADSTQTSQSIGFATKIHFGSLYADSCKYGIWANASAGAQPYQQPQIRVENLSAAAIAPGLSTAISGGAAIQVDPAGSADISIGRLMSEGAITSPINLANTSFQTRLRVGDLLSRSNTGPAIANAGGGIINDVSIGSIPTVPGAITDGKPMVFNTPLANGGVVTMTSGGSFTNANPRRGFTFSGAGTIASYTINLPATPDDGREFYISPLVAVTSLTVAAASGQAVQNAPTNLTAGVSVTFMYIAGLSAWVRR